MLCQQPTGFVNPDRPNVVCLLDKSLYGLRQAPRAWFNRFAAFVIRIGFTPTRLDSSLFVLQRGNDIVYLLLYVDDIVLTGSSPQLLQELIRHLQVEFAVKTLVTFVSFSASTYSATPAASTCPSNATSKTFSSVRAWRIANRPPPRSTPRVKCPPTVRSSTTPSTTEA